MSFAMLLSFPAGAVEAVLDARAKEVQMTDREKFEAWFRDIFMSGMDDAGEFDEERNCYVTFQVHMAHQGYLAGRQQMAEEAAALAETIGTARYDPRYNIGCADCADSIRMLGGVVPTVDTPRAVTAEEDSILHAAILGGSTLVAKGRSCHCQACDPQGNGFDTPMRMILCATCGNKRCPHATDHRNACTNSNELGQKGSSWEGVQALATPTEGKT